MVRTPNSYDIGHVTVLGTLFIVFAVLVHRPTQPSIPPGLVNEDQLHSGRQSQVWFIPLVDKCVGGR